MPYGRRRFSRKYRRKVSRSGYGPKRRRRFRRGVFNPFSHTHRPRYGFEQRRSVPSVQRRFSGTRASTFRRKALTFGGKVPPGWDPPYGAHVKDHFHANWAYVNRFGSTPWGRDRQNAWRKGRPLHQIRRFGSAVKNTAQTVKPYYKQFSPYLQTAVNNLAPAYSAPVQQARSFADWVFSYV